MKIYGVIITSGNGIFWGHEYYESKKKGIIVNFVNAMF